MTMLKDVQNDNAEGVQDAVTSFQDDNAEGASG